MNTDRPSKPVFPNFFIVGAMKAGTSSLGHHLGRHPDLAFSAIRSNYFDQDKKYALGPDWYASFFEGLGQFRAVGEKVPAYSYRPGRTPPVPARIAALLPKSKIIWILRNPVDRAYSHYWFDVFLGKEQRSFEAALADHEKNGVGPAHDYRHRGVYVDQINLYLDYFPREQMHIMLLRDLKRDPVGAMKGVFEFLELDPGKAALDTSKRRNQTHRPRSVWLQRFLSKALFHRNTKLYYRLASLTSHPEPGYPRMNEATREALAAFYAPHNQALAGLTGLDLSHWDSFDQTS